MSITSKPVTPEYEVDLGNAHDIEPTFVRYGNNLIDQEGRIYALGSPIHGLRNWSATCQERACQYYHKRKSLSCECSQIREVKP